MGTPYRLSCDTDMPFSIPTDPKAVDLVSALPEIPTRKVHERKVQVYDRLIFVFSDMVGFTRISAASTPQAMFATVKKLFDAYDALAEAHHVYKVEHVGDAYMAAAGHFDLTPTSTSTPILRRGKQTPSAGASPWGAR